MSIKVTGISQVYVGHCYMNATWMHLIKPLVLWPTLFSMVGCQWCSCSAAIPYWEPLFWVVEAYDSLTSLYGDQKASGSEGSNWKFCLHITLTLVVGHSRSHRDQWNDLLAWKRHPGTPNKVLQCTALQPSMWVCDLPHIGLRSTVWETLFFYFSTLLNLHYEIRYKNR